MIICEGDGELGQAPLPNIIFLHAHNFPAALSIQFKIENQKGETRLCGNLKYTKDCRTSAVTRCSLAERGDERKRASTRKRNKKPGRKLWPDVEEENNRKSQTNYNQRLAVTLLFCSLDPIFSAKTRKVLIPLPSRSGGRRKNTSPLLYYRYSAFFPYFCSAAHLHFASKKKEKRGKKRAKLLGPFFPPPAINFRLIVPTTHPTFPNGLNVAHSEEKKKGTAVKKRERVVSGLWAQKVTTYGFANRSLIARGQEIASGHHTFPPNTVLFPEKRGK